MLVVVHKTSVSKNSKSDFEWGCIENIEISLFVISNEDEKKRDVFTTYL